MTFAEAFAKLCELAPAYCSLKVEAERHHDGTVAIEWRLYDGARDPGWGNEHPTAEAALAEYQGVKASQSVDGIDPIPESST